jgi:hypothetical protein
MSCTQDAFSWSKRHHIHGICEENEDMKHTAPRKIVSVLLLMALLLSVASTAVFAQGNPNEECPAGSVLVAKFNWSGGAYVFEKPAGNENIVLLSNATVNGGDWDTSHSGQLIGYVIVKGGTATDIINAGGTTGGSFSNANLLNNGGQIPGISNIQFCSIGTSPSGAGNPAFVLPDLQPRLTVGQFLLQMVGRTL